MSGSDLDLENRVITMEGSYSSSPVNLKNARIVEGFSTLTETTVEFVSSNDMIDMQDFLGAEIHLNIEDQDQEHRTFTGHCIGIEHVGLYQGLQHYVLDVRPWLWFLTRERNNRIFQELSVVEIFDEIMGQHGFSGDVKKSLNETYKPRVYCVQYDETDFEFLSRLMEEEGIYYFFENDGKKLKMVLADSISAHNPTPKFSSIDFHFKEGQYRKETDHIFDWAERAGITTGKVTLKDYDFTKPKAPMKDVKAIPKGKHSYKNKEHYMYPGHSRIEGTGEGYSRVRMESLAVQHEISRGAGNVRNLGVGQVFKLKDHPRDVVNADYLVVRCVHEFQIETDYEDEETKKPLFESKLPVDEDNTDSYRNVFDVIPKSVPFRAPQDTHWPEIPGLQTAVVTGPSGEEIYTDEYGRIKVQFFWDRLGKKDEHTTCWVRVVMPWTGKNWGMISIPRIGQEVVIQFEEGDPDRPICTGMLYNADTMPPYALPANMTQTGLVTRSSKQGNANTFNELIFEDKIEKEFVRLQSERDYKETIKNNAEITIGLEHQDPGDLTQTVYHTKTETIQTGDHIFSVDTGNQEIFVKTNHTKQVDGESSTTIKQDTAFEVTDGNYSQTISSGDVAREVSMGSESKTISMGDWTVKTTAGSIEFTAGMEIKFTVGGNSITIDNSGITVKGLMVTVDGSATVDIGSPMTTVTGDGLLTLDGGLTMIN